MGDVSYEPLIRDMTWSYSRLNTFDDCPYRWYLKYIRYPRAERKELFFASYGTFMHELIASFYAGEKSADELVTEYLQTFRERVKGRAPTQIVFKNYFLSGLNYLKNLEPPTNRILAVEREVHFKIGNNPFIGFVDREEEDDVGILIADNKSKILKPRSKRNKPTKADQELDSYLRQLYLYSIPVEAQYGELPHKLCFDCYRGQTLVEEPFNTEAYQKTIEWADQKIEEIAKETEFRPNMEFFKCRYLCEMQDQCDYFQLTKG